ncbi:MAG: hypothetical protein AAGJ40_22440 [Planctomycetota bacterium]
MSTIALPVRSHDPTCVVPFVVAGDDAARWLPLVGTFVPMILGRVRPPTMIEIHHLAPLTRLEPSNELKPSGILLATSAPNPIPEMHVDPAIVELINDWSQAHPSWLILVAGDGLSMKQPGHEAAGLMELGANAIFDGPTEFASQMGVLVRYIDVIPT